MSNDALKITYWVAVVIIMPAADQGLREILPLPSLLGFALVIALAWHPIGLLFVVPAAWSGTAGWGWPWWLGVLYSALPLPAVLAHDNWRAFRTPPDTTLR